MHTNENVLFIKSAAMDNNPQIHLDEKIHICEICQKIFSNETSLNDHLWVHTSQKPHVCEICNKGFSQKMPPKKSSTKTFR